MPDKKVVAIFGAGTGLGVSLAARFAREGYQVAIVARRANERVAELANGGVEAFAFPADLTDIPGIPGLVSSIETQLGAIDVAIYSPVPANTAFVAAVDFDAAKAQMFAPIFTYAPIEVIHSVLPGMLARGDGAVVVVSGLSAVYSMPGMSGPGPLMAAVRNYVLTLNAEAGPRGVYAGTVSIGGGIERSEGFTALIASGIPMDPNFPVLDPDAIAEDIWNLVAKRDRPEVVIPPLSPV
jgi:NAD(P)-dependent dehydrogenase (short-subunit alcohol dehydrogenase family)